MEEGISIGEACATHSISDFEQTCNPDGTVKRHPNTTTFSLNNSEVSITVNNTYLQVGGVALAIAMIILVVLIIKKRKRKTKSVNK